MHLIINIGREAGSKPLLTDLAAILTTSMFRRLSSKVELAV